MVDAEIADDWGLEVQLFPVQLHTVASKNGDKTQPYSGFCILHGLQHSRLGDCFRLRGTGL